MTVIKQKIGGVWTPILVGEQGPPGPPGLPGPANGAFNVADYGAVGDGVANDTAAVVAAITAAKAAGGGEVYIPAGTYVVTQVSVTGANKVTVRGSGQSSILTSGFNGPVFQFDGCDGVLLADFKVACTGAGGSQSAIVLLNATHSTVRGVTILNAGYDGILLLYGCVGCIVTECVVDGCGDDGINIGGGGSGNPATSDCTVVANTVINVVNDGIHISDATNRITAVGNTVRACGNGVGIYGARNITVSANTIEAPTSYGIHFPGIGSENVVLSANVIRGAQRGIMMSGTVTSRLRFTDNVIIDAVAYGIVLSQSTITVTDASITGNLIRGGCVTAGMFLSGVSHVQVIGNTLTDQGGIAIHIGGSIGATHVTCSGNHVRGSVGTSILVAHVALFPSTDITIVNNTLSPTTARGIHHAGGARFLISGNRVVNASDYAIVASAASGTSGMGMIVDNFVTGGCTSAGIFAGLYDDVDISRNVVTGITGTNEITIASGSRVFISGQRATDVSGGSKGLRVPAPVAATTPGSVVKKIEVFDNAGTSLGFIPVYGAIT